MIVRRESLLVEIGTEEMPPATLAEMGEKFAAGLSSALSEAKFCERSARAFYTPRRLAVQVPEVLARQPDQHVVRKGPPLSQAYGVDGKPTPAAIGFAKSCQLPVDSLERSETEGRLLAAFTQPGAALEEIMSQVLDQAVAAIPIAKRMRWDEKHVEFVRPVRWLCVLHGTKVLACRLFGVTAGGKTCGHRYHHPGMVAVESAECYEKTLERKQVIADFALRRRHIVAAVEAEAAAAGGRVFAEPADFDLTAALTEWPQAATAAFDKTFLSLPEEIVIHTLRESVQVFPVTDASGMLMPRFIFVANVESPDVAVVRNGYERVVRPRLADAAFFFEQDKKTKLEDRHAQLKDVVFQQKLGTLADKTARIEKLAIMLAGTCDADAADLSRAARLCKCDLTTNMVGEFPALQGVVGRLYADADGEAQAVGIAIDEHYRPRHAGDVLPTSAIGSALALADKTDTITGIFSTGNAPTGAKDPFALRRAALGIIRILIEKKIALDLKSLIRDSLSLHRNHPSNSDCADEVFAFFQERLKGYCLDQGSAYDRVDAVTAVQPVCPLDFIRRLQAVEHFTRMPEAESLTRMNKRIRNILKNQELPQDASDTALPDEPAEQNLQQAAASCAAHVKLLLDKVRYLDAMLELGRLREPMDRFFDEVMVMSENQTQRSRRLMLLARIRSLFLEIADFSRLNTGTNRAADQP